MLNITGSGIKNLWRHHFLPGQVDRNVSKNEKQSIMSVLSRMKYSSTHLKIVFFFWGPFFPFSTPLISLFLFSFLLFLNFLPFLPALSLFLNLLISFTIFLLLSLFLLLLDSYLCDLMIHSPCAERKQKCLVQSFTLVVFSSMLIPET